MLQTVNIVTTAALPWRTGTAILALFRAFHLAQRGLDVHLYQPWIPPGQQRSLFGGTLSFDTPAAQADHIRSHLPNPHCPRLHLAFYPARYWDSLGSILPTVALAGCLRICDWLILEEPEHLSWKRPWGHFRTVSERVTGIVLTNYRYYCAHAVPRLPWVADIVERYNRWLIRRHCDDVIVLSKTHPDLPSARQIQVSGIHSAFFASAGQSGDANGLYFMGKLIWEKGFRDLIDLLAMGERRDIDIFGAGRDREAIAAYASERGVRLHFKGLSSQPAHDLARYKVFVNASKSEVLCTTTAEALGQRKFVILPKDPSNEPFYPFRNALVYDSPETFQACLRHARAHQPIADPLEASLSWEAAVERLLDHHERAS